MVSFPKVNINSLPASLWPNSQYRLSLSAFSSKTSAIFAAPSSPVKCSGNLVSHIAQTLCPLPGKSQSNLDLKEEVVVYVAVTGCHIEFHTSVFCNAPLFTVIRSNPVASSRLPERLATVLKGLNGVQNTHFYTLLNLTLILIKIRQPLAQEQSLS